MTARGNLPGASLAPMQEKNNMNHKASVEQVRVEDLQQVGTHDVVSLVERVQLAGSQLLDGLAQTLAGSPALATTAAAGILIVLLTRRAAERRSNEDPLRA